MGNENLIEPVEIALNMEEAGSKFYLGSAEKVTNAFIKRLLTSLAKDEEDHYNNIKIIYDSFKQNNNWPENVKITANKDSKAIFEEHAVKNSNEIVKAEVDMTIIKMALDFEKKSYVFYEKLSGETEDNNVKMFFKKLSEIENDHYKLLDDTYQYLNNPADYFVNEEKPIFEG